jgi:hypothetical protein
MYFAITYKLHGYALIAYVEPGNTIAHKLFVEGEHATSTLRSLAQESNRLDACEVIQRDQRIAALREEILKLCFKVSKATEQNDEDIRFSPEATACINEAARFLRKAMDSLVSAQHYSPWILGFPKS